MQLEGRSEGGRGGRHVDISWREADRPQLSRGDGGGGGRAVCCLPPFRRRSASDRLPQPEKGAASRSGGPCSGAATHARSPVSATSAAAASTAQRRRTGRRGAPSPAAAPMECRSRVPCLLLTARAAAARFGCRQEAQRGSGGQSAGSSRSRVCATSLRALAAAAAAARAAAGALPFHLNCRAGCHTNMLYIRSMHAIRKHSSHFTLHGVEPFSHAAAGHPASAQHPCQPSRYGQQPAGAGTPPCAPASARGCRPRCSSAPQHSRHSDAGRAWRRSPGRRRRAGAPAGCWARRLRQAAQLTAGRPPCCRHERMPDHLSINKQCICKQVAARQHAVAWHASPACRAQQVKR